ncbi:hypothetical protein Tco_0892552 [Tanacetum coccineum]|uniref:Uncharacterized protein n=1 Tax=Tanacetum coccineum TaxID=301880 RepID=A0ABQ5C691_9ASTR
MSFASIKTNSLFYTEKSYLDPGRDAGLGRRCARSVGIGDGEKKRKEGMEWGNMKRKRKILKEGKDPIGFKDFFQNFIVIRGTGRIGEGRRGRRGKIALILECGKKSEKEKGKRNLGRTLRERCGVRKELILPVCWVL